MRKINSVNRSPAAVRAGICGIFAVMLVLNFLTPYVADDYVYMFSFSTKERLETICDLIPSMYVHCLRMNGRVVSHTLEQLFMLVPKWVFNFCNAGVFTLGVFLLYRIANFARKPNLLLLAGIGMGVWCSIPAFGQVALWQVGSVNYFWAVTGCLLFLLPYLIRYLRGTEPAWKVWQQALFCGGSLLFGMYSEISSFVGIYLGLALLVVGAVHKKQTLKTWLLLPAAAACIGYIVMLTMPAQIAAKAAEGLSLGLLVRNFIRSSWMLVKYSAIPLTVWAVCFGIGVRKKITPERLILSGLLVTGAVGANYMTMVASYYPERCMCTTAVLLVLAIGLPAAEFEWNKAAKRTFAALTVCFALLFSVGCWDIASCHAQFRAREAAIEQAKASGERSLVLDIVEYKTMYSPFWELRDLSDETADTWPNSSMAKVYGVDSILGKK